MPKWRNQSASRTEGPSTPGSGRDDASVDSWPGYSTLTGPYPVRVETARNPVAKRPFPHAGRGRFSPVAEDFHPSPARGRPAGRSSLSHRLPFPPSLAREARGSADRDQNQRTGAHFVGTAPASSRITRSARHAPRVATIFRAGRRISPDSHATRGGGAAGSDTRRTRRTHNPVCGIETVSGRSFPWPRCNRSRQTAPPIPRR